MTPNLSTRAARAIIYANAQASRKRKASPLRKKAVLLTAQLIARDNQRRGKHYTREQLNALRG